MQVINWLEVEKEGALAMLTRNLLLVRELELHKGFRHCHSYVISGLGEGASRHPGSRTIRRPGDQIL